MKLLMEIVIIILIVLLVKILLDEKMKNKKFKKNYAKETEKIIDLKNKIYNNNIKEYGESQLNIDYSKYYKKDYVMTQTELIFYRKLKQITDKLELTIFPEVDLERIINVYNNDYGYRNRIKSRCIDFTIVNNKNCKIICCVELDDYTHNRRDRQQRDKFINDLFKHVGLTLLRIKVGNYNLEEIEKNIKEAI